MYYDNIRYGGYDYTQCMSNRAVQAYEDGAKPMSKWTKKKIINAIIDRIFECEISDDTRKKLENHTLAFLKDNFLVYDSWHHTSLAYNETYFYTINLYEVDEAIEIINRTEEKKIVEKKKPLEWYPVKARWKVSICKKHCRRTSWTYEDVEGFGKSNGKVFYSFRGDKKLVKGVHYFEHKIDMKEARKGYKKVKGDLKGFKKFMEN